MSPRIQAVLIRFLLFFVVGFVAVFIPLLQTTYAAGQAAFNPSQFLWAVLGAVIAGLAGATEKLFGPQLANVLLSNTVYIPPDPAPAPKPAATTPVSAAALMGALQARAAQTPVQPPTQTVSSPNLPSSPAPPPNP